MKSNYSEDYKILKKTIDEALREYTREENMGLIQEAKNFYFSQTGKVNEDDDDFESRMTAFNEWYFFQHVPENWTRTLAEDYCIENELDQELTDALTVNFQHSLFEYLGEGMLGGKPRLKDYILNKKIDLSDRFPLPSLVKGDIFTGRVIFFRGEYYLLEGIGTLPVDVKNILKRQSRKVRKLKDQLEKERFLLKVEALKSKWKRYVHVDIRKIFQFD